MKQVTLHIPDNKFQFFIELLQDHGFIKDVPAEEGFIITEEQKSQIDEERRKIRENPDYLLDWDIIRHELKVD